MPIPTESGRFTRAGVDAHVREVHLCRGCFCAFRNFRVDEIFKGNDRHPASLHLIPALATTPNEKRLGNVKEPPPPRIPPTFQIKSERHIR